MKTLSVFLLGAASLFAQSQVVLQQPAPTNVSNVSISGGAAGSNTYWYWVVAVYPIGKVLPNGPAIATARATPSGSNAIRISWGPVQGAASYDILKTTTSATPTGACACALATAQTGSSVNDTGAALSAYTVQSNAGPAGATMILNNRDGAAPYVSVFVQSSAGVSVYKLALTSGTVVPGECQIVGPDGVIVSSGFCVFRNTANTYTGGGLQDLGAAKLTPPITTVAGLPAAAAGNANNVYVVTDGLNSGDCTVGGGTSRALCVSTGSSWQSLGGSSSSPNIATIVRPVPGNFSWVNQGTATLSTAGQGLNINGPGATGTQVRLQVANAPATPWVCTMNVAVVTVAGNARAGAFLRESGTGKLLSIGAGGGTPTQLSVDHWASASAFTGTAGSYSSGVPVFANGFWVQFAFDGVNVSVRLSPDGVNFGEVYTEAAASFFTVGPNQCGIGFDSEGTGSPPQLVTLLSYSN